MVAVAAGLVVDLNSEDDGTSSVGFRRALAVLFKQSSPGVAAPGRLGSGHFAVAGTAGMAYSVSAGGLVLVRATTGGAYLIGMPESVSVPTAPADGVNPRIDRIYARQPDPALDGAGVDVQFVVDVVSGTPAATPSAPALPSGAYELARKVIAAGATSTAAGAAFTNVAPTTTLNIGEVTDDRLFIGPSSATPPAGARVWFQI